jgi:hypothetical protein
MTMMTTKKEIFGYMGGREKEATIIKSLQSILSKLVLDKPCNEFNINKEVTITITIKTKE